MIHILCADLASADQIIYDELYDRASPNRKQRADRYKRMEDKLRCVVADALLKKALGTEHYQTGKGKNGKPYILKRRDFHYNLSHSGRYVVIAWGECEVGVDVQQHDTRANTELIAKRFFAPDEQNYCLGDPLRFYEIWTKKESYLKYTGDGLGKDLRSFSVLAQNPEIFCQHQILEGGYSLSLCTMDQSCGVEILKPEQLL